ncbi:MAG: hypothetical protein WKH64_06515 [Chloroflexia bacterium]
MAALVSRYSGNPLALRLVAESIQDLYDGDVAAFLREAPVFDDIRDVLDEQFSRLPGLAQEILYWLAIEREPVAASVLRANLLHPPSHRAMLEALRTLRRHSLVEGADLAGGPAWRARAPGLAEPEYGARRAFTLQNVIMEYVAGRLVDEVCKEVEDERPDRLNRHALLQAWAKEYVRGSQERIILAPVAERLVARLGREGLTVRLRRVLEAVRREGPRAPGYAAGNVLNLLLHLGAEPRTATSGSVYGGRTSGRLAPDWPIRLDLSGSAFTDTFRDIACLAEPRRTAARGRLRRLRHPSVARGTGSRPQPCAATPASGVPPPCPDGATLASGERTAPEAAEGDERAVAGARDSRRDGWGGRSPSAAAVGGGGDDGLVRLGMRTPVGWVGRSAAAPAS